MRSLMCVLVLAVMLSPQTLHATSPQARSLPRDCPPGAHVEAVHPLDATYRVVVWTRSSSWLAVSRTTDGGTNWDYNTHSVPGTLTCSPSVVVDEAGKIHIAVGLLTFVHGTQSGGICLITSSDGGNTITGSEQPLVDNYSYWSRTFHSLPQLAIETQHPKGEPRQIYLVWLQTITESDGRRTFQVMFTRSHDGGNTFILPAQRLSQFSIYDADHPSDLTVSADQEGHVTVKWFQVDRNTDGTSRKSVTRTSSDRGVTFSFQVDGND